MIQTARSRDVAMVTDLWRVLAKIDSPSFHSVRWHSTTDGNIVTPIIALTSTMIPLRLVKCLELRFSNPWDLVAHLHGWMGAHMVKVRCLCAGF